MLQLRTGRKSDSISRAICQSNFQVSDDDFWEWCTQFPFLLAGTSWSFQGCQCILYVWTGRVKERKRKRRGKERGGTILKINWITALTSSGVPPNNNKKNKILPVFYRLQRKTNSYYPANWFRDWQAYVFSSASNICLNLRCLSCN